MEPRSIARVIAIIDMTLSVLSMFGVIVHIFMVVFHKGQDIAGPGGVIISAGSEATVLTLAGVFSLLKICASWCLIKGTNDMVDILKGLRYCRIWRLITAIFVGGNIGMCIHWISSGSAIVPAPVMITIVLLTIFHFISIGFVQQYILLLCVKLLTPNVELIIAPKAPLSGV